MKTDLNSLQLDGDLVLVGGVSTYALMYDRSGNYAMLAAATTPTDSLAGIATGCIWINTSGGSNTTMYVNEGSSTSSTWKALRTTTGGGGGSTDLDGAYSNGQTITVDEGTIALTDATTGALDTLSINKTGAGSGDLIQLTGGAAATGAFVKMTMGTAIAAQGLYLDCSAGARTGSDIFVNDDSTAAHSVIDINSSGAGATIGFDWTGSYVGSPAGSGISLTLGAASNLDTIPFVLTAGSGNRGPMFDLNLNYTDSATSSPLFDIDVTTVIDSNILDFNTSGACTGNLIYANLDNAVAMTGLHFEGSGARTQPFVELFTDCTGAVNLLEATISGVSSGNVFDFNMNAAHTGNVIDIDMDLAVGGKAVYIDAGGGVRTATLVDIKSDGTGNAHTLVVTDTATGTGDIFKVALNGAKTGGVVLDIDMDAALGAKALVLDAGAGLRTASMAVVTHDGSGTVPFWDIGISNTGAGATSNYWDIDVTGVYTGHVLYVLYEAAATGGAIKLDMTSAVAAPALSIVGAGARTDDLIQIDDASTGASARSIFDINITGAGTFPVLDISTGNTSINATPILLSLGTGARAVAIIKIDDTGTTSASTIPLIDINFTAAGSGTALDISYATAAHTGDAIKVAMGTNLDGSAIVLTGVGVRTDDLIQIDDTSTGNSHIFDINLTGVYTGNIFDASFATGAATGNAINLAMGTNVAGKAINITSAATGVTGTGSLFNGEHTGALVAGASAFWLHSTGSPDGTASLVKLTQDTGAGSAGATLLTLAATGTNVEALAITAGLAFLSAATATPGSGNGETLPTATNVVFYDPVAARTGVILAAGLRDGQQVKVVNIASGAYSITFATAGTSHVAFGASCVIPQNLSQSFTWNVATSLWYSNAVV